MLISEKIQTNNEKTEIKSMSNRIGLSLLGYFLIMTCWSFLYFKIAQLLGFDSNSALKFAEEPMAENLIQGIVSLCMVLVPFCVFCRVCLQKPRNIVSLAKPKGKKMYIFGAALGFCSFASFSVNVASSIFDGFGITAPSVSLQNPKGILGFTVAALVTAALPALIEEFAIRGIVLGILRKYGDGFAIICSAAVFGLIHATAFQIPFAFLIGLALGFVAVKTESIWLCTAVHFTNNIICTAFSYAMQFVDNRVFLFVNAALDVFFLMLFILCTVKISKEDDNFFTIEKSDTKLNEKQKLVKFFVSPAFIIAVAASLYIAFFLR